MCFFHVFFSTQAFVSDFARDGKQASARAFTRDGTQAPVQAFARDGKQASARVFSQVGAQVLRQPGRQKYKLLQNYIFRNLLFIVF